MTTMRWGLLSIAVRTVAVITVFAIAAVLVWERQPRWSTNDAESASAGAETIDYEELRERRREAIARERARAALPPGSPRDPDDVDRLIAEGSIPAQHRDLWLATPYNTPDGETKLRNLFEVIPEDRSGACEYPAQGPRICWNHFDNHPYLMYDLDTLRQLAAEDDAVAAAALSIAIPYTSPGSFEERFYYATRAAELTGKGGDILRFSHEAIVHPAFRRMENPGALAEIYVFARHADSFDTSWRRSVRLETTLVRHRGWERDDLQTRADEIIAELYANGKAIAESKLRSTS